MYHVLLVLVSVSQSWPKAVCWSVLVFLPVVVRLFSVQQVLTTVISPGRVWLEDLSSHYLTFLTQHSLLEAS